LTRSGATLLGQGVRPEELPQHLWLDWTGETCDVYLCGPEFEHMPRLHRSSESVSDAVMWCQYWAMDRGLVASVRSLAEIDTAQRVGSRTLTLRLYRQSEFYR
jgi:hypothetical protein